jgi:hypothetical protein
MHPLLKNAPMAVAYFHECSRGGGGRGGGGPCRRGKLLFAAVLVAYALVFLFQFFTVPLPSPKQRPFLEFLGIGSVSSGGSSATVNHNRRSNDDNDGDDAAFPLCAINFYGLPRSFKSLVLPFVIQNVLLPNARYNCDFFIHHHIRMVDPGGRDGRSGAIDPEDIFLLEEAIQAVHYNSSNTRANVAKNVMTQQHNVATPPLIVFANTTEEDFLHHYKSFLHEIHSARGPDGNLLYVPFRHPSYKNDTIDNVIKMWHGQESVWNLMVANNHGDGERTVASSSPKHYSRVAMLRSDVVYVTPIDIFKIPARQDSAKSKNKQGFFSWLMTSGTNVQGDDDDDGSGGWDYKNAVAVIPNFARHPVNDRMIYGPYDAVKIWASERFLRLPTQHLRNLQQHERDRHSINDTSTSKIKAGISLRQGDGVHSERFLCFTIFPAIRNAGIEIRSDPDLCFLRARADESIRFADCDLLHVTKNNHEFIETFLNHHHDGRPTTTTTTGQQQRTCLLNTIDRDRKMAQLECRQEHSERRHDSEVDSQQSSMPLEWQTQMSPVTNTTWHKGCDPTNKGWRKASCLKENEAWLLAA